MSTREQTKARSIPVQHPIPGAADEPVFNEPWEAQAFALAVHLNETGLFEWSQWAELFGENLSKSQQINPEATYYEVWLDTLETLLTKKTATSMEELVGEQDAWRAAAKKTPHGEPIELARSVAQNRFKLNEKPG